MEVGWGYDLGGCKAGVNQASATNRGTGVAEDMHLVIRLLACKPIPQHDARSTMQALGEE